MSDGRIFTSEALTQDVVVECDVCIVGSGSGGSWLAHELVNQGKRVVLLEEGGHHTRREFDMTEARAFPTLYQELGNRGTDDLSLSILQGRSVGGGTTVNWCSSFRTPERILKFWREAYGSQLTTEMLSPHWDAVEKRLRIAEWPQALMNENNRVLWEGCEKLGYEKAMLRRNVHGCLNLGYCGMGCPVDAKQSMLVTTLPDAVEKGLLLYANTSARRLTWAGRKVEAVLAEVLHPATNRPTGIGVTVKPKLVALCGGAINSPGLLLRSGLEADGRVGQRTWFQPVLISMAKFEQEIKAFQGAPQSVSSHHFIERGPGKMGFFLEVPPVHPMLASLIFSGNGEQTQSLLADFPHLQACLALAVDGLLPEETGGTVRLRRDGFSRYSITYDFTPALWECFRVAQKEMAKIQFAAGALEVRTLHANSVVLKSVADIDKLDDAAWAPTQVKVATAHQLGGCTMGEKPSNSVVDPHLRFHSMDNLYVVDGSVFPSAPGVNPQESIFGIARWAARHIGDAVPS
jgi:choline dehydrogenase-like flavoprotein